MRKQMKIMILQRKNRRRTEKTLQEVHPGSRALQFLTVMQEIQILPVMTEIIQEMMKMPE